MEPAVAIDDAEIAADEAHRVAAVVEFGDADSFAGQCLADEHMLAAPLDRAIATHAADLVSGIIPGLVGSRRHLPP